MKKYNLDACALIAFFNDERGADVVENLLLEAACGNCIVTMNKYNLLEVYYGFSRTDGEAYADGVLSKVKNTFIRIYDVLTDDLLRQAGKLKVTYKISLADSMVLAQAMADDSIVVTSDHHEFDAVERSGTIQFHWIR